MRRPGEDTIDRGLYTRADYVRAAEVIRRIDTCHTYRLDVEAAGDEAKGVLIARTVRDIIEDTTLEQLRAMVVQLTTPELRPAVPVVVASCTCGVMSGGIPDRRVSCPTHGGAELERRHNPPAAPTLQLYRAAMPTSWELYCIDSGRAVRVEGDRCLSHGADAAMCRTSVRAPQCTHQIVSANHTAPVCSECGVPLVLNTDLRSGS